MSRRSFWCGTIKKRKGKFTALLVYSGKAIQKTFRDKASAELFLMYKRHDILTEELKWTDSEITRLK